MEDFTIRVYSGKNRSRYTCIYSQANNIWSCLIFNGHHFIREFVDKHLIACIRISGSFLAEKGNVIEVTSIDKSNIYLTILESTIRMARRKVLIQFSKN